MPTNTALAVDHVDPSDSHALCRSHRVTTLPSHLRDFHCFYALASLQEPQTFREASSRKKSWMHCIRLEHGIWLISPLEKLLLVINGFIRSKLDRMTLLITTRLALLPGVLLKSMRLIMRRFLLLWLDFLLSRLSYSRFCGSQMATLSYGCQK